MGCILFCLPGIYIALTGLGAGGGRPKAQETAALTNSILYGVYTIAGWCAGPVLNLLKPKWTIIIGGICYPLYVGSLWYYDRIGGQEFPLTAGALLGIGAALLWTSSGFIQFAYPEEDQKGKYITLQWILCSAGSTVGALIAFGTTVKNTESAGVSNAVCIAWIMIMTVALVAAFFLIEDPINVVREGGQHITMFQPPTLKNEVKGILSVMIDPKVVILLPAMFVAEMCLALTSSINVYYFNLRTRSLNNLLFQAVMIPSPLLLGWILDNKRIQSRKLRGAMGTAYVAVITIGATCGLLAWTLKNNISRSNDSRAVDWKDSAFAPGVVLYLLFGVIYACFQIIVQWTLAALTNDPALCARYAGAFKGTVSLGMCVSFTVDSQGMSFRDQIIMQLTLYASGVFCLFYVVLVYVRQTNYFVEEGVIVPTGAENALECGEEMDMKQKD
ncbi:unnamed protein product [Penicillium olsonii]|nr:unnamed protein product [Penicillium olsonii]